MRKLKGKAISAKTVKMKLKNHWTVSDFLENYGISEDELMELLRDLFHGDIGEIKRDLKQNEVLKKSAKKKDNTETNEPEAKIEAAEIQGAEAVETQEEKISDKNEKADIEEGAEVKMVQEQEKKLKLLTEEQEKAATLQQNIIALEVNHDELISRKKVIQTQELPKLKAVLEDYKNKIQETQVQVISLNDELNEIVGKVSEANETLAKKRAMLQALEEEIQALSTVDIFVYASGDIEVSACTEIKIPEDSAVDWIWVVSSNTSLCKEMTIGQIQSVAKVIEIGKELKSWQTVFENDACQKLFDSLMAKHQ